MNKYTKTIFFIIGLGVFAYLINDYGLDNIISNIKKTGWWFVPVIGVWGIVYYMNRSEERRVGKECRSRWSPYH